MSTLELQDAFQLLGIEPDASEAQIRTAYRKRSLQLHPDKVRDVPPDVAADRFHRLTTAYEELMNPATRAALASTLERERERKARQSAFDDRRRAMAADLEQREANDRLARQQREHQRRERERRIAQLREEGYNMRVDAHERLLKAWQERMHAAGPTAKPNEDLPPWGTLDKTVLVRFPSEQHEEMLGSGEGITTPLGSALSAAYGRLVSLTERTRTSQKKRREVSVIATFVDGIDAWCAVREGSELRCTHPQLQDCWVGWSDETGKARNHVPARIAYWCEHGMGPDEARDASVGAQGHDATHVAAPDAGEGFDYDYEARTLARLRRAATQAV